MMALVWFFVFGLKLSQALAGFIAGFSLDYFGYVPNVAQAPDTLEGIRILMTLIPCGLMVIGIAFLLFYPINAKMHAEMLEEIQARNGYNLSRNA